MNWGELLHLFNWDNYYISDVRGLDIGGSTEVVDYFVSVEDGI